MNLSKLLPLELKVGHGAYDLFATRNLDPAFERFAKQVKQRDRHMCRFCGFKSVSAMTVVNINHDYRDNKMSNLATSCPFCLQAHFIEAVGSLLPGGGTLIYLPEMTQNQLSALTHVCFAAIVNGSPHALDSDRYIRSLKLRSSPVEKQYGKHMSDPKFMGRMLIDTPVNDIEERKAIMLKDLRLLPSLKYFEKAILDWAHYAGERA
ncbi:type IVB secretion system protein IcmJDotN [Candidatus Comchoanobacter bicostacola]|uniref:Type IVB secretion system protein IcmJDotN n=1 Tax=Candidatus Comchoanobacter bicostacola TaxID=2919598 RepID=A0ABY5DJM4_9GAMM|nr:type IVB secretion system protein IcmJDotN [Candidatus Comchoanobacter bicostacola]UTC24395.1 type IVB secretion system protein IcmJDotN [Candidatus Comchoanobacter bicostacola]